MMADHQRTGGLATIHLIRVDDPSPFGVVVHDAAGRIDRLHREAPAGRGTLERDQRRHLPPRARGPRRDPRRPPVSIERETFPALIAAGRPLYAYTTDDYWIDLGNPEAYLDAHRHIFDGEMPLGASPEIDGPGRETIPASAVRPPVFIGRDCRIAPDAVVGPYTVLGDGCEIHAQAIVADSLLWDEVTVGEGAELAWAIVASRARIGAGARVGRGAVIGHDAQIAPGATIEDNARIAVERP
jgi:NDP-sugar pyrophosphorylase family protein